MNSHVPNDFFESEAQEHMSIMQEIRRYIHSHPEAGADQPETVKYLASKFEDLPGVKTQFGDGHVGLVVDIKGGGDGPTIGLRADMDALYMDETDAPEHLPNKFGFRTTIDGLMHACGHDAHCAILTGAGLIIHKNRQHFKGTVRLLFQPGEEGFHGAQRMLEAGCLNDLDQVYAMHCIPTYKTGQLAYRKGGITSAIDMFKVKIKGIGGHGSAPEKASDQVLAASQIICNLQNIVSRRISPLENAVVSVCYVQGGNEISTTVMPAECEFAGSIRTYNLDIQKNIRQFFYEVCEHTAKSIHPSCVVDIEYKQMYPVTINNSQLVDGITPIFSGFIGQSDLHVDCNPLLGSEDFSVMTNKVPGVFMLLGVTNPDTDPLKAPYNHNPAFDIDESSLVVGAKVFANIVFGMC